MKKLYLISAAILVAIPSAFASEDVEAIAVIKTENGPVRISKSVFDAKQHTLHVADEHHDEHGVSRHHSPNPEPIAPVAGTAPAAPIAPVAAVPSRQFGVLQNKNKFFVVDGTNGTLVTDVAAFDPKGYASNKEAWEVIAAAAMASASDNGGAAS